MNNKFKYAKYFVASLLAFLCWTHAEAQQALTLKECIDYGLANHESNRIYNNKILDAEASIQQGKSAYLPHINLNGAFDDNLKVQTSVIPGALVGAAEDQRVAFTKQYSLNVSAQLDQTIYDQGLITSFKAYKYVEQEAALNKTQNDEKLIYNISSAYSQVLVSLAQVEYLSANLNMYKEQDIIASLQVSKGVLTQVDGDKIKVNYLNAMSQLNAAQNTLQNSKNQLKLEMGYPLTDAIEIDTTSLKTLIPILENSIEETEYQVKNRTDYKLSENNISQLMIDEQRLKLKGLPKLTGYAKYGSVGFGDNVSESFSSLNEYSAIGLKLSVPLFTGFEKRAQVKQAHYQLLTAQGNLKLDEQAYTMEYENANNQLIKAKANMDNDLRTLELSESVFKAVDLQYHKGTTDLTDWLNTQRTLKESQSNYVSSLYSFYEAIISLEQAKGTLKNFHNTLQ